MADIELSVGLQKGSANTSQIKSELEGLLKGLAGSKATKINIEPVISSDAFKDFQAQLTSSLDGISKSAAETVSSLKQVSQVIQEINSKDFNINLKMEGGKSITDQLDVYKAAVKDYVQGYQQALNELARLNSSGAFRNSIAGVKRAGALSDFRDEFSNIMGYAGDYSAMLSKIEDRMSKVQTATGASRIAKEASQYWDSVIPILEKANSLGLSNFDLSKFKFPEIPKDVAQTAQQMTGIFDQIAPGFKSSIDEMKIMLQSAVEEINSGISNIGKGASADGMKQAAESVRAATESAASSINSEKQALTQVIPAKSQVAAKEAEVAAQSNQVATAAVAAAESIKVENDALDEQSRLYKRRVTYFDKDGNPTSRTTRYPGSSLGNGLGNDTVVRERYKDGSWETLDTNEIHNRAQQYSNAVAVWKKAELDRLQVIDQIARLQARINTNGDQNGVLQGQIDALIGTRPGADGARSLNELDALIPTLEAEMHLFDDLEANTHSYANALDELGARRQRYSTQWAQSYRQQDPFLGSDPKEYYSQLSRVADLQNQIMNAQRNWSAAANGSSASSYGGLSQLAADLNVLSAGLSTMTKSNAEAEIARISAQFRQLGLEITNAGENHKSFFAQMTDFKSIFTSLFTPMRVYMALLNTIKQATKDAIELQDTFVDLQIVTGKSGKEFNAYTKDAVNTSKKLGVATRDIVTATTAFARLGYSLEESSILSQYTTMLEKVGSIGAEDAQNAITALLKAFPEDVNIDNIESVMDKLVTVGNNFPISVSQIAEGMNNASSALAAAGNSFEQSVALLTAANTTIQNASRSSTGLRTITARLTNTTTDLEELGESDFTHAKYQELVNALTKQHVSLIDEVTGEYRSTYDIISDIADVWETMNSKERAALATAISGTRQQAVFYSLINNFKDSAASAMDAMASSGGALEKAYDVYLDSITAHINQFKAALAGFGQDILGPLTPLINAIIDIGSAIFNLVSIVMTALGPAIGFISNIISNVISSISTLVTSISTIASEAPAATSAIVALGTALAALMIINSSPVWAASPVGAVILGIVSAIAALSGVISAIKSSSLDSVVKQEQEAMSKLSALEAKSKSVNDRIQELELVKASGASNWSLQLEKELTNLKIENQLVEAQIKLQKDLADAKNKEKRDKARSFVDKAAPKSAAHLTPSLLDQTNAYLYVLADKSTSAETLEETSNALWEYIEKVQEAKDALDPKKDAEYIERLDAALAESLAKIGASAGSIPEEVQDAVSAVDVYDLAGGFDKIKESIDGASEAVSAFSSALDETLSAGGVTSDTIGKITEAFGDLEGFDISKIFTATENGVLVNNEEYDKLFEQYIDKQKDDVDEFISHANDRIAELQEKITLAENPIFVGENAPEGAVVDEETIQSWNEEIADLTKQKNAAEIYSATLNGLTSSLYQYSEATKSVDKIDVFSTIASGIQDVKQLIDSGFGNTDQVTKFFDFLLGENRTKDNVAALAELEQAMTGVDDSAKSLLDLLFTYDRNGNLTSKGLFDFRDWAVANGKGITLNPETGAYDIDADLLSGTTGLSKDFISWYSLALNEATAYVDDLDAAIADVKDNFDVIGSAFSESLSATGITADSVKQVTDIFSEVFKDAKDIKFNAADLFDFTANGVKMNTDELDSLLANYVEIQRAKIEDAIREEYETDPTLKNSLVWFDAWSAAYTEYTDALNDYRKGLISLEELQEKENTLRNAETNLDNTANATNARVTYLKAELVELERITSAYNKYQLVKNSGNSRDIFEEFAKDLSSVEELIKQGWGNDASVTEYFKQIFGDTGDIEDIDKVISDLGMSVRDLFTFDSDGNFTSEGINKLFDSVKELHPELIATGADGAQAFDESIDSVMALADWLGITDEFARYLVATFNEMSDFTPESKLEKIAESVTGATDAVDVFASAMDEAMSAGGVSLDTIEKLSKLFGDLEGFDLSKLFYSSDNGVGINKDEYDRLIDEYIASKKAELDEFISDTDDKIAELEAKQKVYKNWKKTGEVISYTDSGGGEGFKDGGYEEDIAALKEQREAAELYKNVIDGLSDSWLKYEAAKSSVDYKDMYSSVADDVQSVRDLINSGFGNTDQVTKFFDFLLGDNRNKDNAAALAELDKAITGVDDSAKSLLDVLFTFDRNGNLTSKGLFDFRDWAVENGKGITLGEDGQYSIDADLLAEKTGLSKDFITWYTNALKEATEYADDLDAAIADAKGNFDTIGSAIGESLSSAGMTAESVKQVSEIFSEAFDDFDASKLFDFTTTGIRMNTNELDSLLTDYVQTQKEKINEAIAVEEEELASTGRSTSARILYLKAELAALDELTSAYNSYQIAKSSGNYRDTFEELASDLSNIETLVNTGWGNDTEVTEYFKQIFGDDGNIKDLDREISGLGMSIKDLFTFDDDGNFTSEGIGKLFDAVKELHPELISTGKDGSEAFNASSDSISVLADWLGVTNEFAGYLVQTFSEMTAVVPKVETVAEILDKAKEGYSSIQSALSESLSSTGMTADSAKTIMQLFGSLDGFNAKEFFEITGTGIHMNTEQLEKFTDQYVELQKQKIETKIKSQTAEVAKLRAEYDKLTDEQKNTREAQEKLSKIDTFEKDIEQARQAYGEIVALTNAYNSYLAAKSNGDRSDPYADIKNAYKDIGGYIERGMYNAEVVSKYLDTVLGEVGAEGGRTGNNIEDYERLSEVIEGTSYSLMDFFTVSKDGAKATSEGVDNFVLALLDLQKQGKFTKDVITDLGDGMYRLDFTDGGFEEMAAAFGMGYDAFLLLGEAMRDAGWEINFEDLLKDLYGVKDAAQEAGTSIRDNITQQLSDFGAGGNVDLLNRPIIDASVLRDAGWKDAAEGAATVFSSTFSNAAGDIAINFTPIIVDENGNFKGVMSPDELAAYASEVIEGVREDDKNLQIGAKFTGENAIQEASSAAKKIHELQEEYYLGGAEDIDETTAEVKLEPDTSAVDGAINDLNGTPITITANADTSAAISAIDALNGRTITINAVATVSGLPGGVDGSGAGVPGLASGTKNAPGGKALVNEDGPELISDNGIAYIANGGKPALVNLSKGAIVLTADETRDALGRRGINKKINAYAKGMKDYDDPAVGTKRGFVEAIIDVVKKSSWSGEGSINNGKKNGSDGYGGGGSGGNDNEKEEKKEKIDWIEVAIDRIERAIDELADVVASAFKKLSTRLKASTDEVAKIQEEIVLAKRGAERYFKEAESVTLSNELKERARNGAIDINEYDKDTAEQINEYLKWYEKGLDLQEKVAELHENIAEIYQDRFDMVQDDYDNQLEQIEHEIEMQEKNVDMVNARGYLANASFYEKMAEIESRRLAKMRAEMTDLQKYFTEAMDSGEIDEGSEAWYEMQSSINGVAEAIADANIQLVEYEKTMRSIAWDTFDYVIDRFSQLSEEANFIISLMESGELYDDRGQFNNAGLTALGMHSLNYDAYMQKADEYAKELEAINHLIEDDPYDTDLIKRREELLSLQRDSILAAEDEKDAIKDLVADGIDKELEALKKLIDEYKDSLDSAKDLYDYQNRLSEQTESISNIQKQLTAYAGDTSEENRARVQKLQKDLANAQKDLRETEYERSISDQKKMLDELYDEYEELLNARLDDINKLMQDMIDMTNEHLPDIREKIDEMTSAVGYNITDEMSTALDGVFSYYDQFFTEVTSISTVLDGIYSMVGAMAQASGAIRAYSSGGIVDYTGLAMLHGSPGAPEMVLNPSDTARFLQMISAMHSIYDFGDSSSRSIALRDTAGSLGGTTIGSINLDIEIDHVQDYNDFVTQLRDDPKFERLVQAMTIEPALGKSMFSKNRINF